MEQTQVSIIAKLKSENEKLRLENEDLRLKEVTFDPRAVAPHHCHPASDTADPSSGKHYHQSPLEVSDAARHSLPHHQWPHHQADEGSRFNVKDLQQTNAGGASYRSPSSPVNFQTFVVNSMHNSGGPGGARNGGNKLDFDGSYEEDKPLRVASAAGAAAKHPQRLLGEIAFQLEQRILAYVFQGQVTFYGFTVLNVREKIVQVATRPFTGMLDEGYQRHLLARHAELMDKLAAKAGYNPSSHPMFAQFIINSYGRLAARETRDLDQPDAVRRALVGVAPTYVLKDMLVLLGCLQYMAGKDGKGLFLW